MPKKEKNKTVGAGSKPARKTNKKTKTSKKITMEQKRKRRKILKWTSLIILMFVAIILFLLSSVFNIKEIKVINNNKISEQEIVNLSSIKVNENMFKFLKIKASENIKTNPYIESAEIHRKLNETIEINVKERVTTYMLPINEAEYAYMNNQGYILEISSEKLEVPIIIGYSTESVEPGNRLEVADLKKLNTVVQILNTAKEKDLAEKITSINIEDEKDFVITMESENKIIHFGDSKSINDKFVKLVAVLEDTVGEKGEIFLKNVDKIYFRKEV